MMKWLIAISLLLALVAGCTDMYDQPAVEYQDGPHLSPQQGAIPVTGIEVYDPTVSLKNPVKPDEKSLARGRELYLINCSMCHGLGEDEKYPGPVGGHLVPPPPDLRDARIKNLPPDAIYQRITMGFGRMPAFRNRLSPEDRWHIVNHVLAVSSSR